MAKGCTMEPSARPPGGGAEREDGEGGPAWLPPPGPGRLCGRHFLLRSHLPSSPPWGAQHPHPQWRNEAQMRSLETARRPRWAAVITVLDESLPRIRALGLDPRPGPGA